MVNKVSKKETRKETKAKKYLTPGKGELDKMMLGAIRRGRVRDLDLFKKIKRRPAVIRDIRFPKGYRIPRPEDLGQTDYEVYIRFEDCDMRGIEDYGPVEYLLYCKDCDLRGIELNQFTYCRLRGCDLRDANMAGLCLSSADWIEDCDLRGTTGWDMISSTSVFGTKRTLAQLAAYIPMCCPREGSYKGYKSCRCMYYDRSGLATPRAIVVLEIPAHARRSSAFGRKCRASEAVVKAIWGYGKDGKRVKLESAVSSHDPDFVYRVGETVEPSRPFCENRFEECAPGIHHFMTEQEAKEYPL